VTSQLFTEKESKASLEPFSVPEYCTCIALS